MKRHPIFIIAALLLSSAVFAQQPVKLVVVISLDQFPYEYISKYRTYFTHGGFNYLLNNGANFVDCRYLHAATNTGPGHAVIMSGSYGNANGIVDNLWFDRSTGSMAYCVEDRTVSMVGTDSGEGRSPKNFSTATLGDQMKIHTNFQSKVISVSNKDRSAILMGGKLADASYWTVDSLYVTSSYYRQDLPKWVESFNESGRYRSYFGKAWNLLLSEEEYKKHGIDDGIGESNHLGSRFPHVVDGGNSEELTGAYSYALLASPYGVEILMEFAQEAVKNEQLGQRGVTDLLCLGVSSTDYVGHAYGPQSWEVMDLTIRMDRFLEEFFSFLDSTVGLENCIVVLTSDHGVGPIPEALRHANPNMPAGRITRQQLLGPAKEALEKRHGPLTSTGGWTLGESSRNIYLNDQALNEKGIDREPTATFMKQEISKLPFVAAAFTAAELSRNAVSGDLAEACLFSFHPERSGDVVVVLRPYYIFGDPRYTSGASHGSPYSYDSHVPLLLSGPGISPGTYYDRTSPADIAPTIAALLGVEMPPLTQGRILKEALQSGRIH